MANKYLSLEGLTSYDALSKALMDTKDATVLASAKDYADGLADNYDAAGVAATKVQELADGQVATNTSALEILNGDAETDGSVAKTVADAISGLANYDDSSLSERVSANETAISLLNGNSATEGSVAYQVAAAVAQIVSDAPEAYDTLKEISDWISSHADDASAMNSSITTNAADIADLEAFIGALPETAASTTIVEYVSEVVNAFNVGVKEVTTGTTNGTIAVDGTDVSVYGLGSAAYAETAAFDVAGAADEALENAKSYTDEAYTEITTDEINSLFAE